MPHPSPLPLASKVGLVMVRGDITPPQIFLTQVKPKKPSEKANFGMPRGSRAYWQDGELVDVRDEVSAHVHADILEPLTDTLLRETEEEAGIAPHELRTIPLYELGPRLFSSRTGKQFWVHWFVAVVDDAFIARAMTQLPSDALATEWVSVEQLQMRVVQAGVNASYLDVAHAALAGLVAQQLTPIVLA